MAMRTRSCPLGCDGRPTGRLARRRRRWPTSKSRTAACAVRCAVHGHQREGNLPLTDQRHLLNSGQYLLAIITRVSCRRSYTRQGIPVQYATSGGAVASGKGTFRSCPAGRERPPALRRSPTEATVARPGAELTSRAVPDQRGPARPQGGLRRPVQRAGRPVSDPQRRDQGQFGGAVSTTAGQVHAPGTEDPRHPAEGQVSADEGVLPSSFFRQEKAAFNWRLFLWVSESVLGC